MRIPQKNPVTAIVEILEFNKDKNGRICLSPLLSLSVFNLLRSISEVYEIQARCLEDASATLEDVKIQLKDVVRFSKEKNT